MNQKNIEIYIIKSMAIISVVSAHCYALPVGQNGFPWYCALLLRNFGTVGVVCFFIIAGYLYHPEKYTAKQLIIKKGKTIVIPWFVAGLCSVILRNYRVSVAIPFIFGYRSMLYYLPMLMICFLVFYLPLMRKRIVCIAMILVTFVSTVWFHDLFFQVLLNPLGIDPEEWRGYLNPLNWLGYFALGMLAQTDLKCWRKYLYSRVTGILAGIVFVMALAYQLKVGSPGSYFYGGGCLSVRLSGVILMFYIARTVRNKTENQNGLLTKTFVEIGKDCYSIYLWHFLLNRMIVVLFSLPVLIHFVLLRPVIIVAIATGVDALIRKLGKFKYGETLLHVLGLR